MSTLTINLPRPVPRSRAALCVNDVLDGLVRRNVLRQVRYGKMRVGLMEHRIAWHVGREFRFALDLAANSVMFPRFLPAPLPRQLLRELQGCVRSNGVSAIEGATRLDPARGELRVFVTHGALALSITVKNDAYEYCTEQLVQLGDEILNTCLEQSAYRRYRMQYVAKAVSRQQPLTHADVHSTPA